MKYTKHVLLSIVMMIALINEVCLAEIGTPITIDLASGLSNIAYDPYRDKVYVTNSSTNYIEVVDLITQTVGSAILVGSEPRGLDIDPTGDYAYICNYSGMNLSKVDLSTGTEVAQISTPYSPTNIAIAADGEGQIRMGDYGAGGYEGFGFDGQTGTVGSQIEDYWYDAVSTNKRFLLRAGLDWVKKYDADTASWTAQTSIPEFGVNNWEWVNALAVANDGEWVLVSNNGRTKILDGNLAVHGTINFDYRAFAIDSANKLGYAVKGTTLDVIDLETSLVVNSVSLPKNLYYNTGYPASHQWTNLLLNADGSELYELNTDGITIVPTGVPEPATLGLLLVGGLVLLRKGKSK